MPRNSIIIGSPDSGTGDPLRTAFTKIEQNFVELYSLSSLGDGNNIAISGNTISSEDTNGNIILDPNGTGTVSVVGTLSATAFVGDGSGLTGLSGVPANVGDITFSANTISTALTNQDLILDPNGTGNVGINTSNPAAVLHIDETSSDTKLFLTTGNPSVVPTVNAGLNDIVIDNLSTPGRAAGITILSSSTTTSGIAFDDGSVDGFTGGIIYDHTTDQMEFYTGPDTTANLIFSASKSKFSVTRDRINVTGTYTPATAQGAAGDTAGDVAFDGSFMYYCTADYDGSTAIWVRATLNSF